MSDEAVGSRTGSVVALAGRRIDAPDADAPRFPLDSVPRVRAELSALLDRESVHALVCSAACGADLIALEIAGAAGIERHIVLPFDRATFRSSSVVDRPGDWGPLYDRILDGVASTGNLEIGAGNPEDRGIYLAANQGILERAAIIAGTRGSAAGRALKAVIVWEGAHRGPGDVTADFRSRATSAGFEVQVVLTK